MKKVALVHPRNLIRSWSRVFAAHFDGSTPPEDAQLSNAGDWVKQAAEGEAEYVVFPELYPGPFTPDVDCFSLEETMAAMSEAAKESGVWVVFGAAEEEDEKLFNTLRIASPEGEIVADYRKRIPACGEPWSPGEGISVVDCGGLKIGLAICWEAWFPEVGRTLALEGAELIVYPVGALLYELTDSWRTLIAARAIENTAFTAASINLFGKEDGICVAFGPEGVLAERKGEGLIFADLDLERLRWLRATDEEMVIPKPYKTVPGPARSLPIGVVETLLEAKKKYDAAGLGRV
ncbi:MAG: carbon-nitrogen hydrolase family protein [Verrucomicrobiota bacterium]